MLAGRHIKPKPLFPNKKVVSNPWIVKRENIPPSDFTFCCDLIAGEYYLVIPATAREVGFLQLLQKNIDCFLPMEGDGLLITKRCLDGY